MFFFITEMTLAGQRIFKIHTMHLVYNHLKKNYIQAIWRYLTYKTFEHYFHEHKYNRKSSLGNTSVFRFKSINKDSNVKNVLYMLCSLRLYETLII